MITLTTIKIKVTIKQEVLASLLNVGLWTSLSSLPCSETFIRGFAIPFLLSQLSKEINIKSKNKEKRKKFVSSELKLSTVLMNH
jgi:hypothetical protein